MGVGGQGWEWEWGGWGEGEGEVAGMMWWERGDMGVFLCLDMALRKRFYEVWNVQDGVRIPTYCDG